MAEHNLSLSFITSACEHTSTQTAHRRGKCVCGMRICDAAVQLSLRSEEHVPFYTAQSLTPPPSSHKISISSWFHKHYKWDSMGATDCVSLLFSLSSSLLPSFFFLLTVTSLVSWDRVARETRPQTGPLRQRSPKHRTAQLSPAQRSSCYVFLEAWLQLSKPAYRAGLIWEAHVTLLKLLCWSNKCALGVILCMNNEPLFLSVTARELCPVICFSRCVF